MPSSDLLQLPALIEDSSTADQVQLCLTKFSGQFRIIEAEDVVSAPVKMILKDMQKVEADLSPEHASDLLKALVCFRCNDFDHIPAAVDEDLWTNEALLRLKTLLGPSAQLRCRMRQWW